MKQFFIHTKNKNSITKISLTGITKLNLIITKIKTKNVLTVTNLDILQAIEDYHELIKLLTLQRTTQQKLMKSSVLSLTLIKLS